MVQSESKWKEPASILWSVLAVDCPSFFRAPLQSFYDFHHYILRGINSVMKIVAATLVFLDMWGVRFFVFVFYWKTA